MAGGGGLWQQNAQEHPNAQPQLCEVKPGTSLQGSFVPYASHEPLAFDARQWHSSSKTSAPQLLLIGYTPRMLRKLDAASRCVLWKQGMTFLPRTKDEYWSTNCDRSILTRRRPCPRRAMFAPTSKDVLPFPLQCIGQVRYCEPWCVKGDKKTKHLWKNGRGKASGTAWSGKSVFTLCAPGPQQAEGEDLCPKSELKNEPKSQGQGEALKSLRSQPESGSDQLPLPPLASSSSGAASGGSQGEAYSIDRRGSNINDSSTDLTQQSSPVSSRTSVQPPVSEPLSELAVEEIVGLLSPRSRHYLHSRARAYSRGLRFVGEDRVGQVLAEIVRRGALQSILLSGRKPPYNAAPAPVYTSAPSLSSPQPSLAEEEATLPMPLISQAPRGFSGGCAQPSRPHQPHVPSASSQSSELSFWERQGRPPPSESGSSCRKP